LFETNEFEESEVFLFNTDWLGRKDRFTSSSVFERSISHDNSNRFVASDVFGVIANDETMSAEAVDFVETGYPPVTDGPNGTTDIFTVTEAFSHTPPQRTKNPTVIFEKTEIFNQTISFNVTRPFEVSATFSGLSEAVIAAVTSSVTGATVSATAALAVANKFCKSSSANKALKIAEDIDLPDLDRDDKGKVDGEAKEDEVDDDNNDDDDNSDNDDNDDEGLDLESGDGDDNRDSGGGNPEGEPDASGLGDGRPEVKEQTGNRMNGLRPRPPAAQPVFPTRWSR
jgi:hypothetical protein